MKVYNTIVIPSGGSLLRLTIFYPLAFGFLSLVFILAYMGSPTVWQTLMGIFAVVIIGLPIVRVVKRALLL